MCFLHHLAPDTRFGPRPGAKIQIGSKADHEDVSGRRIGTKGAESPSFARIAFYLVGKLINSVFRGL